MDIHKDAAGDRAFSDAGSHWWTDMKPWRYGLLSLRGHVERLVAGMAYMTKRRIIRSAFPVRFWKRGWKLLGVLSRQPGGPRLVLGCFYGRGMTDGHG